MNKGLLPQLPEQRQLIHDLVMMHRATGLSPPEEEILQKLEGEEMDSGPSEKESSLTTRHE